MKKGYIKIVIFCVVVIGAIIALVMLNRSSDYYLQEINVATYEKYLNEKKTFILYVKQDGCSHCEQFTPIVQQIFAGNKIVAYYINLSTLSNSEAETFNKLVEVTGTPTTVFYKDGEEIDKMAGSKSTTFVQSKLETLGYVNK